MDRRLVLACAGLSLILVAMSAHAALRAPQVPVSGTALQAFFASQGQVIDVATQQLEFARVSLAPSQAITLHEVGGSQSATATLGLYNAAFASPPLYQLWPGAALPGWFVIASFRTAPTRLVLNLFDANSALVGTTTYLAGPPDPSNMGFYCAGPADLAYSEDGRNAAGQPRMLAFAGTGAHVGENWLAWESSPGPGADYADVIYLLGATLTPVEALPTSWGALKQRFR